MFCCYPCDLIMFPADFLDECTDIIPPYILLVISDCLYAFAPFSSKSTLLKRVPKKTYWNSEVGSDQRHKLAWKRRIIISEYFTGARA